VTGNGAVGKGCFGDSDRRVGRLDQPLTACVAQLEGVSCGGPMVHVSFAGEGTPFFERVGLLDGSAFAPRDSVGGDEVLVLRRDDADEVVSASNMV
jgi:hypothetical protein